MPARSGKNWSTLYIRYTLTELNPPQPSIHVRVAMHPAVHAPHHQLRPPRVERHISDHLCSVARGPKPAQHAAAAQIVHICCLVFAASCQVPHAGTERKANWHLQQQTCSSIAEQGERYHEQCIVTHADNPAAYCSVCRGECRACPAMPVGQCQAAHACRLPTSATAICYVISGTSDCVVYEAAHIPPPCTSHPNNMHSKQAPAVLAALQGCTAPHLAVLVSTEAPHT
jgi:hypothetical protein